MTQALNLLGQIFDKLVVLERIENTWRGQAQWKCKCDCGNETFVTSESLRSGNTRSCGCLQIQKFAEQRVVNAAKPKAEVKVCIDCNIAKPVSQFYINTSPTRINMGQRVGYTRRCKICSKTRQQARVHQISQEQYTERRKLPCEICGIYKEEPDKRGSGMHIDHDHETGALRGTLCDCCNRGLGLFGDDPEKLAQAIQYIRKYRQSSILTQQHNELASGSRDGSIQ